VTENRVQNSCVVEWAKHISIVIESHHYLSGGQGKEKEELGHKLSIADGFVQSLKVGQKLGPNARSSGKRGGTGRGTWVFMVKIPIVKK
jgi:hypothetical protein